MPDIRFASVVPPVYTEEQAAEIRERIEAFMERERLDAVERLREVRAAAHRAAEDAAQRRLELSGVGWPD